MGGGYFLSALLLVGAGAVVTIVHTKGRTRLLALLLLVAPWPVGAMLRDAQWTDADGAPVTVAIAQGAIPQDMKWLESNYEQILEQYHGLHREALGADLILWPESALPDFANRLARFLGAVWGEADERGSALMLGIMRIDDDGVNAYNSVIALDQGDPEYYDKHHLVPFGEYFPVPDVVRSWLRLMSLPHSDFTAGAGDQGPLDAGGLRVATSICYEDAYPASLRRAAREAHLLVNVTNDAWFGRSAARYQHLQISRMRATESRRFLLRAANDGVSAIIGPRGEVIATAPEFEPALLRGSIQPRSGATPFLMAGNVPIILLSTLALGAGVLAGRKLPGRAGVYH